MSPRHTDSHSTGSGRAAYVEDESSFQSQSQQSQSSSSTSSESEGSSWGSVDDIGPSESASRPPHAPSISSQSSRPPPTRHSTRPVVLEDETLPHISHPHEPLYHPTSSQPRSSRHLPTLDEDHQRAHSFHSEEPDRRPLHRRPEDEERPIYRHVPARVPSSISSSTDSYDTYYGGGGGHRARGHPHPHPHSHTSDPNAPPYAPVPQPPRHGFPPPNVPGAYDGYDAYGHPSTSPYDAAVIPMPRYDHLPYPAHHNPFGPQAHPSDNPFTPMTSTSASPDYFAPQYERHPAPQPPQQHDPYQQPRHDPYPPQHRPRPQPQPRPQSYAGAPYPGMEFAVAPYYAPPPQPGFSGYPSQGNDPGLMAAYIQELRLRDQVRKSPPSSPPQAAPAPEPKKEPQEDSALTLIKLLDEREAKARVAADLIAQQQAATAAIEKAREEASNMESAKIAKMLQTWKEEEAKARKAEKEAAKAAQAAAEAQAAQAAAIAAAATAAREAAEKEAAAKAKKAEEESSKKIAEAAEKAAALEKAKKELEENLAKIAPQPDDTKGNVHFHDALNRKYDVPWRYAKSWKGMKSLIEQAFSHVDGIGQLVMDGRYDLLGPEGNIILPAVWDIVIQPEWAIRMELWPEPEPEPMLYETMDGGWTTKPPKKDKDGKSKKKSGKGSSSRNPTSPVHMAPMPPPLTPHGMHIIDDDDVVGGRGGGSKSRDKGKKREVRIPGGFFGSWIAGSAGARPRGSGKDSEKPGTSSMVHRHVSNSSSSSSTTSNSNSKELTSSGEEQTQRQHTEVRKVSPGPQQSSLRRERRDMSDNDDFVVVSHRERSAAQGKRQPTIVSDPLCAVM